MGSEPEAEWETIVVFGKKTEMEWKHRRLYFKPRMLGTGLGLNIRRRRMLTVTVLTNFCVPQGPRFGGARGAAGAPAARKN